MKRLAVTGLGGFVGAHLARAAEAGGYSIHGPPAHFDLRDADAVRAFVAEARPTHVVHLAAQSNVASAFADPAETLTVNVIGTLHLLRALSAEKFAGRMLYVSSGDVYGLVPPESLPVTESRVPEPRNPYAVSKVAAELLCRQWFMTENIPIVVARPFNHIGPGQDDRFAVASLAKQVAEIEAGRRDTIEAGDLDVTRDFTDVRDVVLAHLSLLEGGAAGAVYNIGSGRETGLRDILATLGRIAGVAVEVKVDAARLRRAEQRRMVASAARLEQETGWRPTFSIERSLEDILEFWRARIRT